MRQSSKQTTSRIGFGQSPPQQQNTKPFDRSLRQQRPSTAIAVVVKEESPYFSDLDDNEDNDSNVDENTEENKKFGRSSGMSGRAGSEKNRFESDPISSKSHSVSHPQSNSCSQLYRIRKVRPLVQPEKIMLLQEWKSFGEVLATRPTMAECLSFAATVSPSSLATTYGMDVLDQVMLWFVLLTNNTSTTRPWLTGPDSATCLLCTLEQTQRSATVRMCSAFIRMASTYGDFATSSRCTSRTDQNSRHCQRGERPLHVFRADSPAEPYWQ